MDLFGTKRRAAEYVWALLPDDVKALVACFDEETQAGLRSGFAKTRPLFEDPATREDMIKGLREGLREELRSNRRRSTPLDERAGADEEEQQEVCAVATAIVLHLRSGDRGRAEEATLRAAREWQVRRPESAPALYVFLQGVLDARLGEGQYNLPLPPEWSAEIRRLTGAPS